MEILPNVEIAGLALILDSSLVISDVHIGYEEALNKQGILIPRIQFGDIVKSIEGILSTIGNKKLDRIIVNGDLKHEFGTISEQEWRNTLKFIDLLGKYCKEVILIKGNHDTILGPIARKRNVKVLDYYIIEPLQEKSINEKNSILNRTLKNLIKKPKKTLIIHGDKAPDKELLKGVSTIIIGHEHPAVSLKEGPRVEQYKCYLKGKYQGKNLIVQPSFNPIVPGTDVLKEKTLSPFLKQNLDNFSVYVVEDKVYDFGKLGNLKRKI